MDKVERVMKMVKRMSPRKKRREGGGGRGGGGGELESPDTLCDELCRFSLCMSGESVCERFLDGVVSANCNKFCFHWTIVASRVSTLTNVTCELVMPEYCHEALANLYCKSVISVSLPKSSLLTAALMAFFLFG
ncbi:hypothetical protein EXN66_Car005998 [Channa argus]|uniref:Uncharacterized protein n=1 Tax=Channa argus TaxID=215402 RepID=A0A6G1PJY7_CHAAH|nr:hypothetical protein EXN66_Car005998 [Channa argus]